MMDSRMVSIWRNVHVFESVATCDRRLVNNIINVFDSYQDKFKYFDFIGAAKTLRERGLLPQEYCNSLLKKIQDLRRTNSKRHQLLAFVIEIATHVQPGEFFDILRQIGLSDLRELVRYEYNEPLNRQTHREQIPNSERLQRHFYERKSYLDSVNQAERKQFLWDDTNKLKASFDTATNDNELTIAANKFALNTWLCVQQCNRDTGEIRKKLIDMRAHSWPRCVDPILSEIVFESKMAIVSAMEGSFDLAKNYRHHAKCLIREYCDPLMQSIVYHDSRYVSQMFSANNFADTTSVPEECEIGLGVLQTETNGNHFCILMQRSFFLLSAEYYLRVENDFQIDRTIPVSQNDLEKAKQYLHHVEKNLRSGQIVEKRRDMIYCVCMARMHDIQHDFQTAINYLREAEDLSESSALFEQERSNIAMYKSALQRA